jgi:hypothetical protein
MRRATTIAALAVVAGSLLACGSDGETTETDTTSGSGGTAAGSDSGAGTDGATQYRFVGTVLENAEHGPALCLGVSTAIYPPSCGTVPAEPWSWDDVPDVSTEGETTWAEVDVVGTFDGTSFAVTEPPAAATDETRAATATEIPDLSPLCEAEVADPSKLADTDFIAVSGAADGLDGVAATWLSNAEQGLAEQTFNVVVTGDPAAAEAELRPLWGGRLCVEQRDQPTLEELYARQAEIGTTLAGAPVYGSAVDVTTGKVLVTVAVVTDEMQAEVDDRFGEDAITFEQLLQPVG